MMPWQIRKHSWYAIVPESAVPREVVNLTEAEQVKADIIKAIALAGRLALPRSYRYSYIHTHVLLFFVVVDTQVWIRRLYWMV